VYVPEYLTARRSEAALARREQQGDRHPWKAAAQDQEVPKVGYAILGE
jgi:hypothetical protein